MAFYNQYSPGAETRQLLEEKQKHAREILYGGFKPGSEPSQPEESYEERLKRVEDERRGLYETRRRWEEEYSTPRYYNHFIPQTTIKTTGVKVNLEVVKPKIWYFITMFQCPSCERKKIKRARKEGDKPSDPEERKRLVLRYCADCHK